MKNLLLASGLFLAMLPFRASAHEIARGDFMSSKHTVSGHVSAHESGDGNIILSLDSHFMTDIGPDLHLVLEQSAVPMKPDLAKGDLVLEKLMNPMGAQNYQVKLTPDQFAKFKTLSVYCVKYDVVFGYAALK